MITTLIHVYFRQMPPERRVVQQVDPDDFLEEVKETKFYWRNKYPVYGEKPFYTRTTLTGRKAKVVREASMDSILSENRLVFYSSVDFIAREYEIYT